MNTGKLPDFIVVGMQKSGTTSLFHNLKQHPDIEITPNFSENSRGFVNRKETFFFSSPWKPVVASVEHYKTLFNDNGKVQGEVSPEYWRPSAFDKMRTTVPDAKLIIICREPVSRLESAFNHLVERGRSSGTGKGLKWNRWDSEHAFEDNLRHEIDSGSPGMVAMGFYADIIGQILARFDRSQLLVLVAEEYRDSPQRTYDQIFDFLGLPTVPIDNQNRNVKPQKLFRLTPEQRAVLQGIYRPSNERFFSILGREIPEWKDAGG
jgi:hypothetical protein